MEHMQRYHIFETAHGFCVIAWSNLGVTRFRLPAPSAEETRASLLRRLQQAQDAPPPPDIDAAVAGAKRYFAGEKVDFSHVRLDLGSQTEFFTQIYAATRRLGWGQTTTYGALAKELNAGPETARVVGQAMARNPVPLIVPCHRVLAAGRKIGGFSAPGGSSSKMRMLELEGVQFAPEPPAQRSLTL